MAQVVVNCSNGCCWCGCSIVQEQGIAVQSNAYSARHRIVGKFYRSIQPRYTFERNCRNVDTGGGEPHLSAVLVLRDI